MWESLNASIKVHLLITWDCYLFFYYKGKWKTLSDFGAVGSENAPKVFVSSNKTPSFIVSAASHLHPLSHGPTSLPSEKCTEQYKVAGSRSSLFLPELASHTAYLMSNWGAALTVRRGWRGGDTPEANVKEPFHWLFDTPVVLPVSHTSTLTFSLAFCRRVLIYIALDSPRVAATAAVLVQRPVYRSRMVTECEFWTAAGVAERGVTANPRVWIRPLSWHVLMFHVFTRMHKYQPVTASHINT